MAELEEGLLWYLAWRTGKEGGAPVKTRLVKLLYLVEVAYGQATTERVTSLRWRYHHYGPYAAEIEGALDALVADNRLRLVALGSDPGRQAQLFRARFPPPGLLAPDLRAVADEVCRRWAGVPLDDLLSHVYFETAPMQGARPDDVLEFGLGPPDEPTAPGYRPLPPPEISDALRRAVVGWQERLDRALPRVVLSPPSAGDEDRGLMALGEMEERIDEEVLARGRLRLAPETEVSG